MFPFRNFQRFTTAVGAETISEHYNKNAKFYGVFIASVTLFVGAIWGRIGESERRLEKDIKETEESLTNGMKDMKKELKDDIKEIKDLLTPLIVQVKYDSKRIDDIEKNFCYRRLVYYGTFIKKNAEGV